MKSCIWSSCGQAKLHPPTLPSYYKYPPLICSPFASQLTKPGYSNMKLSPPEAQQPLFLSPGPIRGGSADAHIAHPACSTCGLANLIIRCFAPKCPPPPFCISIGRDLLHLSPPHTELKALTVNCTNNPSLHSRTS